MNSSVHWPLHVYKRPFAQNAVEHGAPCVRPYSHQESTLVGLRASGRFFVVFGTALRTLALALAFASLFSFALALVLLGRRALSLPLASARGKAVFGPGIGNSFNYFCSCGILLWCSLHRAVIGHGTRLM